MHRQEVEEEGENESKRKNNCRLLHRNGKKNKEEKGKNIYTHEMWDKNVEWKWKWKKNYRRKRTGKRNAVVVSAYWHNSIYMHPHNHTYRITQTTCTHTKTYIHVCSTLLYIQMNRLPRINRVYGIRNVRKMVMVAMKMVKKNGVLLIKSILSKRTNETNERGERANNNEGTGGNGKRIRLNALKCVLAQC